MVEYIDRGESMSRIFPRYEDETFWQNHLAITMIGAMEREMSEASNICPPEDHERQIESQFVVIANQTKLTAGYINYLERDKKMGPQSICRLIRKLIHHALTYGRIYDNLVGDPLKSTMKLVAVTYYPASKAVKSEFASQTKLIANTHYVLHYDGY